MPEATNKVNSPNDNPDAAATPKAARVTEQRPLRRVGTVRPDNTEPWVVTVDRLSKAKPGDILEIAASQIEILDSYYREVLGQARRSFGWAIAAAGVGLLFFLAAVGFLLVSQSQGVANISLISGGLVEVISAINFYLYAKTSAQLAEFHTRLDGTQRFLLANSLCESLEGDFKQRARLELIRKIAGMGIKEIETPQPHTQ